MDYIKIEMVELLKWLEANLSEKRYLHSIGTAECARDLAKKYNLDEEKAYVAGLLHDCAKCMPDETLVDIIEKNLDVDKIEMMNSKTLHAPVSAFIAKRDFGVEDEEILSAIRWHTLGKINMSDFEKVIFLADKIEPKTRSKDYLQEVRELLNEDDMKSPHSNLPKLGQEQVFTSANTCKKDNGLNKALLKCYKETIKSLVKRDLKICPITIDIYNNLEDIVNVK